MIKERKNFRLDTNLIRMLEHEAEINGVTCTDMLEDIMRRHFESSNTDETVFLYRMESFNRQLNKVDVKVEELAKLFIDYLQFWFRTQPGVPNKNEDMELLHKGLEKTVDFLAAHRNKTREDDKTFMQTIYGNLLEDDPNF